MPYRNAVKQLRLVRQRHQPENSTVSKIQDEYLTVNNEMNSSSINRRPGKTAGPGRTGIQARYTGCQPTYSNIRNGDG